MVSSGTVSSDLSNLKSCVDNANSTVSGLSGSWQGASFDGVAKQIDSAITELLSTISGQMNSFGSACDLYKEYEQVKSDLANAQSSYNAADKDHKSQYSSKISTLTTKLNDLKTQIEALLASIGSGASASSSSSSSTLADTTSNAFGSTSAAGLTPKFGTLTKQTFTASNGTQITHLLYIPDYGQQVSGLSVNMYMTGAGMTGTGEQIMTYGGVGKLLNEKSINPSGIVVIPHVPSGKQYESKAYRDALAELPVAVAKQYNADLNKISLSGHSYGAITAYRIVEEHPNTFAAIVPVSGSAKIKNTDAFKNVKIWAFHGAQDRQGNNTDYRQAVNVINTLKSIGANVSLHAYTEYPNCYHTHTSNTTFSNEFEDEEGETINPLEWAFKQTKA